MLLFSHRVNTASQLKNTPTQYGVEIDLRSYGNDVILHHDPFVKGESFSQWLDYFQHAGIILNVKEEGLEQRIVSLLESNNVKNYFFLDQSFPFLVKSFNSGENSCAVRFSEFESIQTVKSLKGKIEWVWIDCFTHYPLTNINACLLRDIGFRLCLVSPELQGRSEDDEIHGIGTWLKDNDIVIDAVCTKRLDIWKGYAT